MILPPAEGSRLSGGSGPTPVRRLLRRPAVRARQRRRRALLGKEGQALDHIPAHLAARLELKDREIEAILEAVKDLREAVIVRFLLDTGCRAGAIGTITLAGLDQEACTALPSEKGGREAVLDFSHDTAKLLRKWLRKRRDLPYDHVFVTSRGGPMNRGVLWRTLRRLADRAGVGNTRPHKRRHTVGRRFAEAGAPLTVTQSKHNHRSPDVTACYLNQTPAGLRRFTEALSHD
ncbi:MAG: hypothetical protein Kow00120_22270 [Anaerolineae bacterium]